MFLLARVPRCPTYTLASARGPATSNQEMGILLLLELDSSTGVEGVFDRGRHLGVGR